MSARALELLKEIQALIRAGDADVWHRRRIVRGLLDSDRVLELLEELRVELRREAT